MGKSLEFTIPGAPRTKKTHNDLVTQAGRQLLLPSSQFRAWNKTAQMWLARVRSATHGWPIEYPVNCTALFYRDANRGDATGYYQALADALEEACIIRNDSLIVSWDGSRLRKDSHRPRIQVLLTPVEDEEWTPAPGTLAEVFLDEEDTHP